MARGGKFSLYAEPTAAEFEVGRGEMEHVLRVSGRLVALAVVKRPTGREVATYWLRDRGYGMHSLQRQFRQQVLRAAERCEVRRLSWEELGERSALIHDGLARRGRDGMGSGGSGSGVRPRRHPALRRGVCSAVGIWSRI